MSSRGICDSRCAAFLTAMIHKEENTRIRWFLKNQQKLLDRLEKAKGLSNLFTPIRESEKQPSTDIIRLKPLPNWRPLEPDGSISTDIMKPIEPEVISILYQQRVPSFITAENYLNERVKSTPENRYYYPDCTSWVYGWRVKDYPAAPRSKVAKQCVMAQEFYHPTISSIKRDPDWYRPSKRTAFCDEIN